jgi:hypothetical protein
MKSVIYINPSKIDLYTNVNKPRTDKVRRKISFLPYIVSIPVRALLTIFDSILVTNHDLRLSKVEEHRSYIIIRDLIKNYPHIEQSILYDLLISQLKLNKIAIFKKNKLKSSEEILRFIDKYFHDLVISIKLKGFQYTSISQLGSCVIGPNGELIKSLYGRHRFSTSRILGLTSFPLRVDYIDRRYYLKVYNTKLTKKQNIRNIISFVTDKYQ